MNIELSVEEVEILAVLAINSIETNQFGNGVEMHPTLVTQLKNAHSKLIEAIEQSYY